MEAISNATLLTLAQLCKTAAKSNGSLPIFFPKTLKDSYVSSWVMKNPDPNSFYGFWYACILIKSNFSGTLLTLTLAPDEEDQLFISNSMIKNHQIKKLSIVQKMEFESTSFGVFTFSKMEVSKQYKATLSITQSVKHECFKISKSGIPEKVEAIDFPSTLPETDVKNIATRQHSSFLGENDAAVVQEAKRTTFFLTDTTALAERQVLYVKDNAINTSSSENMLESDVDGTLLEELTTETSLSARTPGLYIEIASQGGIGAIHIIIMYIISPEGNYVPLMYNQCSKVVKGYFKETIRKKKKSGFFKKKVKIKRITKLFSDVEEKCGPILTPNDLQPEAVQLQASEVQFQ